MTNIPQKSELFMTQLNDVLCALKIIAEFSWCACEQSCKNCCTQQREKGKESEKKIFYN